VTITGRTDRQADRVRRIMRPAPREEGRTINEYDDDDDDGGGGDEVLW